ncbi:MAG: tRNA (adenosine(37)-N6)-dimethylallyltransferase MiaA [Bacteroidota bacterium]
MTFNDPLLVVIAGPTAVGKTPFGIELAGTCSTEIISADSRQFYREMKIGTAAPSREELAKVPHHFVHHLSIHETYNVSRFEADALALLDNLFDKHRIAVMVGGSGLYIDAVCRGIDHLPDPDPVIRNDLKELLSVSGIEALRDELYKSDPEYAKVVDLANPARLLRALEVCRATGVPYSTLRSNKSKQRPFRILKLALELPRDLLYERIDNRVDRMLENGLFEEALALYPQRHLNALNTVGYRELFDHFEGLTSLEYAVTKIKTNSRRYAKRQLTWFKKDQDYKWFMPDDIGRVLELPECKMQKANIKIKNQL